MFEEGQKIKFFIDTPVEVYLRSIRDAGFNCHVSGNHIIVDSKRYDTEKRIMKAKQIKKARIKSAYTRKELAEEMGTNVQNIIAWENGEKLPSPKHMKLLKELLLW